jgi:glycine/D-amino acid oxidase-like deaminating enzyme
VDACIRNAVVFRWETSVFGLCAENGRAVAVRTNRGVLPAGAILLAAGIGSLAFIAAVGLQLPIVPEQRHVLFVSRAPSGSARIVARFSPAAAGEILGVRGGSEATVWTFLSAERESLVAGGRSFAWSHSASQRIAISILRQDFAALLPGYAHLLTGRVTTRAQACIVDGFPVIGPASMIDNLYFGLHRSDCRGSLAPVVGALAAQTVAAPRTPGAEPYSMERFPQSAPGGQKRVKD